MAWFQVDDSAPDHPKFLRAGHNAFALWVAGLAYCNRLHTDGRIPKEVVSSLLPTMSRPCRARAVTALCSNAVQDPSNPESEPHHSWVDRGTYYEVHHAEEYQETKAEMEQRRQQDRERQRRFRQARLEELSRRDKRVSHASSRARVSNSTQQTPPVVPLAGAKGTNGNSSPGKKPRRLTGIAKENAALVARTPAKPRSLEALRGDVWAAAELRRVPSYLPAIQSATTFAELHRLFDEIEATAAPA
jgi:hypothetical protein